MTEPRVIEMRGRGARGESQADILRRTGQYGVLPTDTDQQVMAKLGDAAISQALTAVDAVEVALDNLQDSVETRDQESKDRDALKLDKAGGIMGGVINMDAYRIEGLGAPDSDDDAARLLDVKEAVKNRLIRVTSSTDYEIVDDPTGLWGGGTNKLYVPRRFTTVQGAGGPITDFTNPVNPECAERAGYCKLERNPNSFILDTLIFNKTDNQFLVLPFPDLATILPTLGDTVVVIARFFRDQIQSDFSVRKASHGMMGNQNPYGRSDMSRMPFLFQTAPAFAPITDSALTALGFTVGQTQTITGSDTAPLAGMSFDKTLHGGQAFFRFYAQTSVAGAWGNPIVFFWSDTGYISQTPLRLERALSTTARIYSGSAVIPNGATRYLVGLSSASGAIQIVTGTQHHASDVDAYDIPKSDYGTLPRMPLIGPDLFVVSGQTLPLYRRNLFIEREGLEPTVLLVSSKGRPTPPMVLGEGGGDIAIDPARLGTSVRVIARAKNEKMFRNFREMTGYVRTVPLVSTATPTILALGDSITNRELPEMVRRYLADWNINASFVGTIKSAINQFDDNPDGPLGEGREGWSAYGTYLGNDLTQAPGGVVQPGGEATYLGLSKADKRSRQVFLNPNTSAGSAAPIVSVGGTNYRFDLAFYLSRFSLAAPNIVLLNLGMNDLYQSTPANFKTAITAIIAEIRRAMPAAKIICWQTVMPNTIEGNRQTAGAFGQIRRALVEVVETRRVSDPNLYLVSAWAHQTAEAWEFFNPTADTAGVRSDIPTESIHPKGAAREQHAYAVACAVANLV